MATLRAVKSSATLAERAYEQIRDRILRGDYPLGSALPRRKLAEDFGMSFLPVSEALQRLERDGLVVVGETDRAVLVAAFGGLYFYMKNRRD